jgi:hypothetical protein
LGFGVELSMDTLNAFAEIIRQRGR